MRSFRCSCGNAVYFENDRCLDCKRTLAFDRTQLALRPMVAGDRRCANTAACNWLVDAADAAYCAACALNEVVPDLADPHRAALYYEVEKAKRRLLFTLFSLGLPVEGRARRPDGLAFRILADARLDNAEADASAEDAVMTGHLDGRITINLMEADPHLRERMRMAMNESYRTLLGHFRHESGHYYWQRLVACGDRRAAFRSRFGDERAPYRQSLDAYYGNGPPAGWQDHYVDAYAAAHPLEDFAVSWAHYLHMIDTLETAAHAGCAIRGREIVDPLADSTVAGFDGLVADWVELASTMNDLNRSMGLADAYPFSLPAPVVAKLRFIHALVDDARQAPA